MRYWMWPFRLRWKKKPLKLKRIVRKRRPHKNARDRLRDFGLSRFRYLWVIPILIAMIVVVASVRVPKTATAFLQQTSSRSEISEAGIAIRSAKYRTSIPAGYRLAVDLAWSSSPQLEEILVTLILRDDGGEAVATETTVIESETLAAQEPMTRAEMDIPYDLHGNYQLTVRVSDGDGQTIQAETQLGPVSVY